MTELKRYDCDCDCGNTLFMAEADGHSVKAEDALALLNENNRLR
jgi:hypothetical protein